MATSNPKQLEAHAEYAQETPPVRHPHKPAQPEVAESTAPAVCPCCKQAIANDDTHTVGLVGMGFRHVFYGLKLIVTSLFRVVRLAVASACYSIGLVGSLARKAGAKVAHPTDRQRLDRLTGQPVN